MRQILFSYDFTPPKLYDAKGDLSKRWYVYYSVRGADGKLHLKKKKAGINKGTTAKERRRIASLVIGQLNDLLKSGWRDNEAPDISIGLPLKEQLTAVLELKKSHMKWRTWQSFNYCLNKFFKWMDQKGYSDMYPKQFTQAHAHAYTDHLLKQGIAAKTFNYQKVNMKHFFTMLQDREIIEKNPFHRIKSLKETPARHVAFTDEQMKKLDEHMLENCYPMYVFTRFVMFTFIRPIEVLRIRVGQVNMKSWTIMVHADQAKASRPRVLEIPVGLREVIKKMNLENYPKDFFLFSRGMVPGKKALTRNAVTENFRRWVKEPLELGINHTLYGYKHYGNAKAFKLGISVEAIRRQNGHATEAQTRTYLRSIGEDANVEFAENMK